MAARPSPLHGLVSRLRTNNLWQRILKYTIATTAAVALSVIPAVADVFGPATFLAPMTTAFGHPGQRLGLMVESLFLIVAGTIVGVGWSTLGLYLSSLAYGDDVGGAYAIRAIFLAIAAVLHGYLRSSSPRLFFFVLFALIVSSITLLGTATAANTGTATHILYPVLSAVGIALLTNVAVFPEFSSTDLGMVTTETLSQAAAMLREATVWFTGPVTVLNLGSDTTLDVGEETQDADTSKEKPRDVGSRAGHSGPVAIDRRGIIKKLAALTDGKPKLRSRLETCKSTLAECSFELAFAVLPPRSLKPISSAGMAGLVQSVVATVDSCESKFALVGENGMQRAAVPPQATAQSSAGQSRDDVREAEAVIDDHATTAGNSLADKVKLVKPRREIESGDAELLESILDRIRQPVTYFQGQIDGAVDVIIACLAYCYDVPKLPSGAVTPKGIGIEEIDIRLELFSTAIANFDKASAEALSRAAIEDMDGAQVLGPCLGRSSV